MSNKSEQALNVIEQYIGDLNEDMAINLYHALAREFHLADTFEYLGHLESALWREGVLCRECAGSYGKETKAIGVNCDAHREPTVSGPPEPSVIYVTPLCEGHIRNDVIRFVKEEDY